MPVAIDYYEIADRQFRQAILPTRLGLQATVWSYGAIAEPDTFRYPAFTIEAMVDCAVRVKWINDLVDTDGDYLPHPLPVDPTLHWANPGGVQTDREGRATFRETPSPSPRVARPDYRDPGPRRSRGLGDPQLHRRRPPIHIHEVQFQVVDREAFGRVTRPPEPWETGDKDTVIACPQEITRVKARFDLPGLFVWHCHIVEHEDHEMIRPVRVGP